MRDRIRKLLIRENHTIADALRCIDNSADGIALLVDENDKLIATITDGDIRRAILRDKRMSEGVKMLLHNRKPPITARSGTPASELLHTMTENRIRHIPIVSADGVLEDIALLNDLVLTHRPQVRAVVMAGGFGKRLRPLTSEQPKPMLTLGDQPLLERTIGRLKDSGIQHISVTTHYMAEAISDHFGDGERFGIKIDYLNEEKPLGTAGALSLLDNLNQPLLVINGDILTDVDFRAMHDYHIEHEADITMAVRKYDMQVPYGVVQLQDHKVSSITEKPTQSCFVNAGIYLLEASVKGAVTKGEHLHMTDLINRSIENGMNVVSFPVREYWIDIGKYEDYEQAKSDIEMGQVN